MIARIALWGLGEELEGIQALRRSLHEEGAAALAAQRGLARWAVVSDDLGDRWGVVALWEDEPGALPAAAVPASAPAVEDALTVEWAGSGDAGDTTAQGGFARLELWRLDPAGRVSLADLRLHVEEEASWLAGETEGLLWAAWLSDDAPGHDRFAVLSVWESAAAAALQGLPGRIAELVGHGPGILEEFDVELTGAPHGRRG